MLTPITPCHCLYWLLPVPYADGHCEAAGPNKRPAQLEYG